MDTNAADLIHRVGESIKNAPPAQKRGDIYTLGTFERAMRNLQHPFSGKYIPEPSQQELRQAVKTVQEAFGKRAFLITPEGSLEGIIQPSGDVGVYFTHYEWSRAARHLCSHEHLKLERREPVYEFSAASLGGCFPLYGAENLSAKYFLWKAGVKSITAGK